ncbi:2-amino-4-hydroxy-6-hydroxymethyldihydropteridine pyrophosphokinase [Formosimonas limnophila]|uniref:2-amino-4-hydroxy-6-hydroxymethyldihydropteridine pyrophosphokinase n=1 Tax=Formosimonas limnophila TaxID=1384487 RepID=A0A8J3FYV5_9BURK|nr:2-amino-4-hydroxy-6-hydroxymethyldihydropteridine diphosphokinase [Formosimonas limnophila]GHA76411.1 2-amino-4-hydroxy-6-hydroxymethyldihydropteridine pyrophosphokinase [Formosimonas limnophila]
MNAVHAYIALGANLGDAQATLRAVFDELAKLPDTQLISTSSLYLSPPFGENADGPDYINAVAKISTTLLPHQLLVELQKLEQKYGRERHYQNAPRTLDLDILLYGDVVLNDEYLTIPHPRMTERAFVLMPLAEIDKDLIWLSAQGQSNCVRECLMKIQPQQIDLIKN